MDQKLLEVIFLQQHVLWVLVFQKGKGFPLRQECWFFKGFFFV